MKHLELPKAITNIAEAKALLNLLYKEGLLYHCEDDATDCLEGLISIEQAEQLNKLMDDIYSFPGNEDRRILATFDPCEYALQLIN